MKIETKDDLLFNTRRVGECMEWEGSPFTKYGYALVLFQGKRMYVHRVMWLFAYGDIPKGSEVDRSCGNPRCIRPDHLVLTNKEDKLNAAVRNPHGKGGVRGERNHRAKLTDEKALEIRVRWAVGGVTQPELAKEYGVTQTAISCLVLGKTWKHVGGIQEAARSKNRRAKLTEDQVREIRRRCGTGESFVSIARDFPVNDWQISRIAHGYQWKTLGKDHE